MTKNKNMKLYFSKYSYLKKCFFMTSRAQMKTTYLELTRFFFCKIWHYLFLVFFFFNFQGTSLFTFCGLKVWHQMKILSSTKAIFGLKSKIASKLSISKIVTCVSDHLRNKSFGYEFKRTFKLFSSKIA